MGWRMKTAVYHHVSADGRVLYIGMSHDPLSRFAGHKSASSWAYDVARIEVFWFATRDEAKAEERRQIHEIRPPHNRHAHMTWVKRKVPA